MRNRSYLWMAGGVFEVTNRDLKFMLADNKIVVLNGGGSRD
jgi:hypothetical protein